MDSCSTHKTYKPIFEVSRDLQEAIDIFMNDSPSISSEEQRLITIIFLSGNAIQAEPCKALFDFLEHFWGDDRVGEIMRFIIMLARAYRKTLNEHGEDAFKPRQAYFHNALATFATVADLSHRLGGIIGECDLLDDYKSPALTELLENSNLLELLEELKAITCSKYEEDWECFETRNGMEVRPKPPLIGPPPHMLSVVGSESIKPRTSKGQIFLTHYLNGLYHRDIDDNTFHGGLFPWKRSVASGASITLGQKWGKGIRYTNDELALFVGTIPWVTASVMRGFVVQLFGVELDERVINTIERGARARWNKENS